MPQYTVMPCLGEQFGRSVSVWLVTFWLNSGSTCLKWLENVCVIRKSVRILKIWLSAVRLIEATLYLLSDAWSKGTYERTLLFPDNCEQSNTIIQKWLSFFMLQALISLTFVLVRHFKIHSKACTSPGISRGGKQRMQNMTIHYFMNPHQHQITNCLQDVVRKRMQKTMNTFNTRGTLWPLVPVLLFSKYNKHFLASLI